MIAVIILILLIVSIILVLAYREGVREQIKHEARITEYNLRKEERLLAEKRLRDALDEEEVEEVNLERAKKQNDVTKLKNKVTNKENKNA